MHVAGGHSAGGGVLPEFEQILDFLPLFRIHFLEDRLGSLVGELGEQIGGGARIHLFHDVGNAAGVEGFEQGFLETRIYFFERVRGYFFIERDKDRFALGRRQIFENVRQIGRVHVREAFMFDLQLDPARWIDFDQIDKFPWDDAGAEVHGEVCQGLPGHGAFEQAAYGASHADGYLGYPQPFAAVLGIPLQVNVVHAYDFPAVHVDDLPVEDVLLQEEQIFVAAQGLEEGILAQLDGSGRGLQYVFDGYEPGSLAGPEEETGNVSGGGPGGDGNIFEPTLDAALPVRDRRAEQEGKAGVPGVLVVHRWPVAV